MAFEREWRDLNTLPRWSLVRVNRRQNLAEHSYYVALYAMQVAELIHWEGSAGALTRWALIHDAPELETGDIPGMTKDAVFDGAAMDALEQRVVSQKFPKYQAWYNAPYPVRSIVKVADIMDAVMYICEEMQSGNKVMGSLPAIPDLQYTTWTDPRYGEPDMSIFNRNMHRLAMAWGKLPAPAHVSLNRLWKEQVIPEIDRALYGMSQRVF